MPNQNVMLLVSCISPYQEYELDLQEFSGSSDETSDDLAEITGRTSELFRIAEPLKTEANNQQFLDESDDEDKQIVLFGNKY